MAGSLPVLLRRNIFMPGSRRNPHPCINYPLKSAYRPALLGPGVKTCAVVNADINPADGCLGRSLPERGKVRFMPMKGKSLVSSKETFLPNSP